MRKEGDDRKFLRNPNDWQTRHVVRAIRDIFCRSFALGARLFVDSFDRRLSREMSFDTAEVEMHERTGTIIDLASGI